MPLEWKADKKWADGYESHITQILRENIGRISNVRTATDEEDTTRATDIVVELDCGDVALRVRRQTRFRDLTLRYRRRPWGVMDAALQRGYEVDKILSGFARWYLYLWTEPGVVADWLLVDLDVVRDAGLIEWAVDVEGRERLNLDNITTFTWLTCSELDEAGAIVNTTLAHAMRGAAA